MKTQLKRILGLMLVAVFTACGGGGGDSPPPPAPTTYTVGGNLSGLGSGKSVTLQNNGGDNLALTANGNFTFATAIPNGGSYNITVLTQPTGQTCTVTGGTGAVSAANVGSVSVTCVNNSSSNWNQLIWGVDNWA